MTAFWRVGDQVLLSVPVSKDARGKVLRRANGRSQITK
jgi:hypothetical protein